MSALAVFSPPPLTSARPARRMAGARIWDEEGARIDFDMSGGAVILGHAHPAVEAAVAAEDGCEDSAAEALRSLIPSAHSVRFCAEESHALPAAISAARRLTGRHRAVTFEAGPMETGDMAALIIDGLGADRAKMTAARNLADAAGAVLILDEGASFFRVHAKGAQGLSGMAADLAVFGASIANGRSLGAVCGHADLVAALDEDDLSPARTAALAAASATLTELSLNPVAARLNELGARLQAKVRTIAAQSAADRVFTLQGPAYLPAPAFASPKLEGVWMRECAASRLICVGPHGLSAAHDEADIAALASAYGRALPVIAAQGVLEAMSRSVPSIDLHSVFGGQE